ncbi:type VI secretion system accessory protein TagJ [Phyllobacterium sp. 0TCS1.6C]|uniref:type VI secretion system accessory protein TagJ n=1 Tax=unclassified Phyllobacterium TaxID=2638441 RepID=UPI002264F03F|nr:MULTISPECIES: type VI secretion system accessory protein TagJ [unclassified Phyllobacterium]MCX8280062.1 type VI secretion system accessory protein TagJ [Phyllobacterium sp. 0TCS1.6C]MCX8294376.1 type VI secretion system accessory protein TagJ [Phyllobacterium sp. 0TCS1.6A]
MTLSASIARLLADDALTDALEAAKAHLKTNPSDKEARHIYIDLLIVQGDYERADAQSALATTLTGEDLVGFALLRNQLRGMAARDAWFTTGAVPEFPQGPSELDKATLKLNIAHRSALREESTVALSALEQVRGERPMVWNGKSVADFRDLDDRIPHAFEVIMSGGAYLWIDFAKIASVALEPIARPRDLAFRRAELALIDGATASVLLPAIYHGSSGDERLLLGRETRWVDEDTGITTGRGQRCFLAGDDFISFHEAENIAAAALPGERKAANG